MGFKSWITEKLNPGQRIIRDMEPVSHRTNRKPFTTGQAYSKIEILNRTANMVIDSVLILSEINIILSRMPMASRQRL